MLKHGAAMANQTQQHRQTDRRIRLQQREKGLFCNGHDDYKSGLLVVLVPLVACDLIE